MTSGKIMASMIVLSALLTGLAVYYLQVYGYYEPLDEVAGAQELRLTGDDMSALPLAATEFRGIDAESSPQRYRSCFRITDPAVTQNARPYEGATPLIGPRWFSCFSAKGLTADLETGAARAFLGQPNIHPGVDRVIAIYPDGRAFAWHQFNSATEERGVMD